MKKRQTSLWLTDKAYEWLRVKAFNTKQSQSTVIENLIEKEIKKNDRRNNND